MAAKILVVDDEPEILSLTKIILEKGGYEVFTASDSVECFKRLKEVRPDLILLDVMMPGDDGWATCKKIKDGKTTKGIPVAIFTVRTSENSIEKSQAYAQADAHIKKPFEMKKLLETVKRLLK